MFGDETASVFNLAFTRWTPMPKHISNRKKVEQNGFVPDIPEERALKLVGTNMAIDRKVLLSIGGFDSACPYFLDDSDLSLRLLLAGTNRPRHPLAEVHHGFAPSWRRTSRRAPLDLFDIGRSSAVFFRRHDTTNAENLFERIRGRERNGCLFI